MTFSNQELSKVESSNLQTQDEMNNLKSEEENNTTSATTTDIPSFGWSAYAERVNGRFAMIGFTAILLIEIISNSGFLHWAGFVR